MVLQRRAGFSHTDRRQQGAPLRGPALAAAAPPPPPIHRVHPIAHPQVLTPADDVHHINKHAFKVPFVCGCRDLGEALRRIAEGAAMIRTKVSGWVAGGGARCRGGDDD